MQARTLEIYAKLGIIDRALELGKRGTGTNIWAEGRKMARVPLGEAGQSVTPYPFILILGQDDNERIMGDKLRDWGISVQWNTELVGAERGIVLGKKSGLDSIRIKAEELGLELDEERQRELLTLVKAEGTERRRVLTDDEFRELAGRESPG